MAGGASLGFFSGKIDNLFEDMQILKPTLFNTVPRLLNRIYAGKLFYKRRRNTTVFIMSDIYRYCTKYTSSTRYDEEIPRVINME